MTAHSNRHATTRSSAIRSVQVIPSLYPSEESPLAGIIVREHDLRVAQALCWQTLNTMVKLIKK